MIDINHRNHTSKEAIGTPDTSRDSSPEPNATCDVDDFARLPSQIAEDVLGDYSILYLLTDVDDPDSLVPELYHHVEPERLRDWRHAGGPPEIVSPATLRRVLDHRTSMIVGPARGRRDWEQPDGEEREETIALSSLSTVEGESLGVLLVGGYREPDVFGPQTLELVETLAGHVAARLESCRLQRRLERSNEKLEEAVDLRDNFISAASHELRSPLSTIQLLAQLLRREARSTETREQEGVPPEHVLERVESLERQVGRMTRLVDRLLNVARLSGRQPRMDVDDVDLVDVVEDVLGTYRQQEDAPDFRVAMPESLVGHWDRERLEQIASNLVSNAVKYGGGRPIDVTVVDLDDTCRLRVRDRGPGLPETDVERLFDRFERGGRERFDEGLGLGLWIVRRVVEEFEGEIEVESDPERGTSIDIVLPRRALTPAQSGD
jgi:signal transduction histidine kinase